MTNKIPSTPERHDDGAAETLRDRLTNLDPQAQARIEHILAIGQARATIHHILNDAIDHAGPRVTFDAACRRLNRDPDNIRRRATDTSTAAKDQG